jgi:hypothetical protein
MPKRLVSLPADWPKCGEADGCASYCGHVGDGYGKRCWQHGGVTPPFGDWFIEHAKHGIYLCKGDESQRISWRAAFLMIKGGRVKRAVFLLNRGKRLREQLADKGVKVTMADPSYYATTYEFEPPYTKPCCPWVTYEVSG